MHINKKRKQESVCVHFFQVFGEKRMSMGKISNLPESIKNESMIFEKGEKKA